MENERNPQAEQMADESMVRCLSAQAAAVWPQESQLIDAYGLGGAIDVLDVACGTGEITRRLAERFPEARVTGVDLVESHLERGRASCAAFGERVRFEAGDAFALGFDDASFDFTLCRHFLQAVPEPMRVLRELARVTRPGGRVHLVAEDYAMMHFHPVTLDTDRFWLEGPTEFARGTGTDLKIGRKAFTYLRELGFADVRVDYVIVDTVRVPRETFAAIWEAWRDGYTDVIAAHTRFSREEVAAYWEEMLACIRNPRGYAVWMVPVVSGVAGPGGS